MMISVRHIVRDMPALIRIMFCCFVIFFAVVMLIEFGGNVEACYEPCKRFHGCYENIDTTSPTDAPELDPEPEPKTASATSLLRPFLTVSLA